MPVAQLLASQRGWGEARSRAFLAQVAVREDKSIGSLTERQRRAVAALLTRIVACAELSSSPPRSAAQTRSGDRKLTESERDLDQACVRVSRFSLGLEAQRQRVAALRSQDPLRPQAERGPATAGRERDRLTRRRRREPQEFDRGRLRGHACALADLHRDRQRGNLARRRGERRAPGRGRRRDRTLGGLGSSRPNATRRGYRRPSGESCGLSSGTAGRAIRGARCSSASVIDAATGQRSMARPADQPDVLAALVPEPGVRPVVHRDRRRPATAQD